jgi:DNA mismatch repair protein MutS2
LGLRTAIMERLRYSCHSPLISAFSSPAAPNSGSSAPPERSAPTIQTETLDLLEWPRLCQHLASFTATKLGAIAAQRLLLPKTQAQTEVLLTQTREAYGLEMSLGGGLQFDGVQDIGESVERAQALGALGGEELLAVATTLSGMRSLRRAVNAHPECSGLNQLIQDLRTYPELEQEIHHCIDDNGDVTDRACPKLAGIRAQLREKRDRILTSLNSIIQRKGNALQELVITQRSGRYVIPVKAPQKDAIPGIVHDSSASGSTLYIEPQSTVNWNNQLRQLERQEAAESLLVRQQLSGKIAEVAEDLERLVAIATQLDLAVARARYALWLEANPPQFLPSPSPHASTPPRPITLRHLRHPLLVWQEKQEQGRSVIPTDVVIQPEIRVVAITGPNTGGKTVTLKTLGLATLMAKAGMFVPAKEPVELPWVDQVLADIGDEQSIEQNLSTFSGHIRRIVRILQALERPSPEQAPNLVLLDEVGAGTDPTEGTALAIALLKSLADQAGLTIATTHFGELKALKYQDERFENASVEFDEASLSPTYRLLWGIPGRSNALSIAQRLGLAPALVESAKTYVGGASHDVNEVIAGLEAQRRRQEEKALAAAQLLATTEALNQDISRKAAALKAREQQLQAEQAEAVQAAVQEAKQKIAQVIRDLQRGPQTAQAAQVATEAVNQVGQRYTPAPPKRQPGYRPVVGDRVRLLRLGSQVAEVLSLPDEEGLLAVRFGIMKTTVSVQDIESLQGEKAVSEAAERRREAEAARQAQQQRAEPQGSGQQESGQQASAPTIRTSRNTLDIRGQRVMDAEPLLEKIISENLGGCIWIIHGIGTGKLRQGVHEFIKQHPLVSRFELAAQTDGGAGVTIAHIQ